MQKTFIVASVLIVLVSAIGIHAFLNLNRGRSSDANNKTAQQQVKKNAKEKDVREVAWEQLSSEQKAFVGGTWEDGTLSKVTLNDDLVMIGVEDKSYKGQEVYLVSFDNGLHSILPLLDAITLDVIGFAPVD